MTDSPELLPCPFCGDAAALTADSEHSTAFTLTHHSKGCPIDDLWDWYPDADQAITAWNTRASVTPPEVVEALAGLCEKYEAIVTDDDEPRSDMDDALVKARAALEKVKAQ